jgi:phosphatidylglycerol:prolipoprotein diacylglycerol transferase
MRSTLFTIPVDGLIPVLGVPLFGWGLLPAVWLLIGVAWAALLVRKHGFSTLIRDSEFLSNAFVWVAVTAALVLMPRILPDGIPLRGYGLMLVCGFGAAGFLAASRIQNAGFNPDIAWDAAIWLFISGVAGCRLFYIVQNFNDMLPRPGRENFLFNLINLTDGGLVLYGGVIAGAVVYWQLCRFRGWNALALGDILITSLFVGVCLGRIGCFLHGCCWGDVCTSGFSVRFPAGSVPFESELYSGLIRKDATQTLPLIPTQLYSSLDSLLLAALTWAYYPLRRRDGAVIVVGCISYALSRFLIEILRADTAGQFGTSLTISQWISLVLAVFGFVLLKQLPQSQTHAPLATDEYRLKPVAA